MGLAGTGVKAAGEVGVGIADGFGISLVDGFGGAAGVGVATAGETGVSVGTSVRVAEGFDVALGIRVSGGMRLWVGTGAGVRVAKVAVACSPVAATVASIFGVSWDGEASQPMANGIIAIATANRVTPGIFNWCPSSIQQVYRRLHYLVYNHLIGSIWPQHRFDLLSNPSSGYR